MTPFFNKNKKSISLREAARSSGYSTGYLSNLCRTGKVIATYVHNEWLVDTISLETFVEAQTDRKEARARSLAEARAREFKMHSGYSEVDKLDSPVLISTSFDVVNNSFRSQAMTLVASMIILASSAFVAQAEFIPQIAEHTLSVADNIASGYVAAFGDIPQHIATKISETENTVREISSRQIVPRSLDNRNAFDLPAIQIPEFDVARVPLSLPTLSVSPMPIKPVLTTEDIQKFVLDTYIMLFTSPPSAEKAYRALGEYVYGSIGTIFDGYRSLIEQSGEKVLSFAATTRDTLRTSPKLVDRVNLALGNAIIDTTHSVIRAEVSLTYVPATVAPASARVTVAFIGSVGTVLADGTQHIAYEMVRSVRNIDILHLPEVQLALPHSWQDAYLGLVGKIALDLEEIRFSQFATVAPALSAVEQVALSTYQTINSFFSSTSRALANLFGSTEDTPLATNIPTPVVVPPPTVVIATSTSARPTTYPLQPIPSISYPTYTTIVQGSPGISEAKLNESLSALRSGLLSQMSSMVAPVSSQVATNIQTIQSIARIERLDNLVISGGDFRNSIFDNGVRVTATDGNFTNLSGGVTQLTSLTTSGTGVFTGALASYTSVTAPFFVATSTTATSTFAGALGIGTTSPASTFAVNGESYFNNALILENVTPVTTTNKLYANAGLLYFAGNLIGGGTVGNWTTDGTHAWRATGNVGIGTTTPATNLSVAGSGYLTGGLGVGVVNTTAGTINVTSYINTSGTTGGYKIDGNLVFMASSTVQSVIIGNQAGNLSMTGLYNIGIGQQALSSVTSGSSVAIGRLALNANTTGSNTAVGNSALEKTVGGDGNVAVGQNALYLNVSGGGNVAVGVTALNSNTGNSNTALGTQAAISNSSGIQNIAVGYQSLYYNQTGSDNIAIGYRSDGFASGGVNSHSNSVALGSLALTNASTGGNNIAIGYGAGDNITTGANNIIIGYDINAPSATSANTLNIGNLIFGTGLDGTDSTLSSGKIGIGTTSPAYKLDVAGFINTDQYSGYKQAGNTILYASSTQESTLVGIGAGNMSMTGTRNNAVGYQALTAVTSGIRNDAFGYQALNANTTGAQNVGVGFNALFSNVSGSNNTAVGYQSLLFTTGGNNTAVGQNTLVQNRAGAGNTALGMEALSTATSTSNQTAVGYGALANSATGVSNLAVGYNALNANTYGSRNVAIGESALRLATSSTDNIAIGYQALYSNITGSTALQGNVAIGSATLYANTTGVQNTAVGYSALGSNTISSGSSAFGYEALLNSTSGTNSAFGSGALKFTTTGGNNNAFGNNALQSNTTGAYNIAIGGGALQLQKTGDYNNAQGHAAMMNNITGKYNIGIGTNASYYNGSATSTTVLGYAAGQGTAAFNAQGYTALGFQAGYSLGTGSDYNTLIGYKSGSNITTGANNILIGADSTGAVDAVGTNNNLTTGSGNIAIGYNISLPSATASGQLNIQNIIYGTGNTGTGSTLSTGNVGIGNTSPSYKLDVAGFINTDQYSGYRQAGNTILYASSTLASAFVGGAGNMTFTGTVNTGVGGVETLDALTSGSANSALGYAALSSNTDGESNTAVGVSALNANIGGDHNTAVGRDTLGSNTTGSYNTALGTNALYYNTSGTGNIAIGYYAGTGDGTANMKSVIDTYATFIGNLATRDPAIASATVLTNITAIGKNAQVGRSNSIVLGGTGADAVNVGIGTTSPGASLSIVNGDQEQIRLGSSSFYYGIGRNTTTGVLNFQGTQDGFTGYSFNQADGTPSLIVTTSSNVGIGTTSPTVKFEVNGPHVAGKGLILAKGVSDHGFIVADTDTPASKDAGFAWQYGGVSKWWAFIGTGSTDLQFLSENNKTITFQNGTGNVGIGTTTPGSLLSLSNSVATAQNTPLFTIASTTGGTSTSTLMAVLANGNVGVGTASPGASINTNSLYFRPDPSGRIVDIYSPNNESVLNLNSNQNSDGAHLGGLYFTRTAGQSDAHEQVAAIQGRQKGTGTLSGGELWFFTKGDSGSALADAPKMFISSTGNIAIGGTETSNGKLTILDELGGSTTGPQILLVRHQDSATVNYGSAITNRHNGTTETLMFKVGAGVNFLDDSATKMTLLASGNVGIGTTSPISLLSVQGNQYTSGSAFFGGAITGTSTLSIQSTTATSTFSTGGLTVGTSQFVVQQTSGNVGIGITAPRAKLDVVGGNVAVDQDYYLVLGSSSGGALGTEWLVGAPNTPTGAQIVTTKALTLQLYNGVNQGLLVRNTSNTSLFELQGSDGKAYFAGNVGIGTTTPAYKLSINSTDSTTNLFQIATTTNQSIFNVLANGNVGVGTTTPGSLLSLNDLANFTTATSTFYGTGGINLAAGCFSIGGTCVGGGGSASLTGTTGQLAYFSGTNTAVGTSTLFISTAGNVGIGTTTPWGKLSVTGAGTGTGLGFIFADFNNSPKFVIQDNGNVGIGTTSPFAKLSIVGDTRIKESTDSATAFVIENSIGSSTIAFSTIDSNSNIFEIATSTGSAYFDVTSDGFVGIGTTSPWRQLSTTGTVAFSGLSVLSAATSTTATNICLDSTGELVKSGVAFVGCIGSSERYKHNIQPLSVDSIAIIKSLQPMSYIYNGDTTNSVTWGFIAEQAKNIDSHLAVTDPNNDLVYNIVDRSFMAVMLQAEKRLLENIDISHSPTTTPSITIDVSGNVGVGTPTPNAKFTVSGNIFATSYETVSMPATSFIFGSTTYTAEIPAAVLTAAGDVDLYKLATYNLSGITALAARLEAQEVRLTSLESRMTALESGAISSASGSPIELSTTSLASAFNSLGAYISRGFAQFGTLIADRFVAATDSAGTSSAGTVTLFAGNTIAQVENAYVTPSTKVFITFNAPVAGSWYVSDKVTGSFRVVLGEAQTADTSFDYFLVQTEGQIATSTPEVGGSQTSSTSGNEASTVTTTPTPEVETPTESAEASGNPETPPTSSSSGDIVAPVVTLIGDAALEIIVGEVFTDPGATATDDIDGDITTSIVVTGAVDTATAGLYTLTYTATDAAGNAGTVSRVVSVLASPEAPADTAPPVEELLPTI